MLLPVTFLILLPCFCGSLAQQELLVDPGPAGVGLYLTPNTTLPPVFHNQLYGPLGAPSSVWHITQWNSPDPLPDTPSPPSSSSPPCHLSSPLWHTESRAGHVCVYAAGTTSPSSVSIEIHQDGTDATCGFEYDSFLEPNTNVFPEYPQGLRPPTTTASLASLSNITVSFGALLLNATVTRNRCGSSPQCGPSGKVDYGYGVLGVVIGNAAAGQTLFYQVQLGDTRDGACPGVRNTCEPSALFWYATDNPYGASNTAGAYGQPCLGMSPSYGIRGRRVPLRFDVLPKLVDAIENGPASMSKDLAQWAVGEIYLGIGLEGSVSQTIILDSVSFTMR